MTNFKWLYWNDYYMIKRKVKNRILHTFHIQSNNIGNNIMKKWYVSKRLLDKKKCSMLIYEMILSNKPCMIARYGGTEINLMTQVERKILTNKDIRLDEAIGELVENAGFFPKNRDLAYRYCDLMKESSRDLDLLGCWFIHMENYFLNTYARQTEITSASNFQPFNEIQAWTKALYGKKVLLIHPFAETIMKQYSKRELLFMDKDFLPDFELYTLKAVQTIAGTKDERFQNWFEALDYMYKESLKIDFEVAIIACGAYGFPLASMLKRAGKKAIHLGGISQLMFGIKGKRYDKNLGLTMYNEHWVRPSEEETPQGAIKVEGACYW